MRVACLDAELLLAGAFLERNRSCAGREAVAVFVVCVDAGGEEVEAVLLPRVKVPDEPIAAIASVPIRMPPTATIAFSFFMKIPFFVTQLFF